MSGDKKSIAENLLITWCRILLIRLAGIQEHFCLPAQRYELLCHSTDIFHAWSMHINNVTSDRRIRINKMDSSDVHDVY